MNESEVRHIIKQFEYKPHRLRGQNFLCDPKVPKAIVDVIGKEYSGPVLEIGPGLGALTRLLVKRFSTVTALEIEQEFAVYLQSELSQSDALQIINIDALCYDFTAFNNAEPYVLFANVPYSITTPLMKKLFLEGGAWSSMILLVQKEAGQRICEGKGRTNSPLTLLTEYFSIAKMCFDVPPSAFWPRPKVMSSVIRLDRRDKPVVDADINELMRLINAAFSERRKVLTNSLSSLDQKGSEYWKTALLECGLQETVRAEQLGLNEFSQLLAWHKSNK